MRAYSASGTLTELERAARKEKGNKELGEGGGEEEYPCKLQCRVE